MGQAAEKELIWLLFGGVVVMLLLAGALLVFFLIYQQKLVSQQLELQRLQSAYQKEMLSATVEAEERERERIGNDLHDELGSALSVAKMLTAQLAESVSVPEREKQVMTTIQGILVDSLQSVRSISQSLHPAVLARFGLAKALHHLKLAGSAAFARGIEIRVELDIALTQTQELALYRITQEAVNNALKHARASHVAVHLLQQPRSLTLTITDDGCGFDYAQAQQSKQLGLGLKSLAARASLLNAALHLESAPGRGTGIRVEIPLPSAHR